MLQAARARGARCAAPQSAGEAQKAGHTRHGSTHKQQKPVLLAAGARKLPPHSGRTVSGPRSGSIAAPTPPAPAAVVECGCIGLLHGRGERRSVRQRVGGRGRLSTGQGTEAVLAGGR